MAPKGSLFRSLQDLEAAGSAERRAARQRRQQQSSGEILQTFLAYRLADAAEKMALGIAIGDPLTLRHEPTNEWDPNAVKVFWKEQEIGYLPKGMAALVAAEVPEAATGLEAVVSGLATTSRRDAFRLQISIPIEKPSRRLKELGVTGDFAWDFDRTSGADKMRLVINSTETAFRELQELLRVSYDVSKCGYSYYPTQDGRHYPWYLSLTDASGRAPADEAPVEQLIRTQFGVPSETTRRLERQKRLEELEEKQEDISQRLQVIRADEARLRRELEASQQQLQQRQSKTKDQKAKAKEKARGLKLELSIAQQELDLAVKENDALALTCQELETTLALRQEELSYFHELSESMSSGTGFGPVGGVADRAGKPDAEASERLLDALRSMAADLRPRQILDLATRICPDSFVVLESAWKSTDEVVGFKRGERLFELLWRLGTRYREARLAGQPDVAGIQVFGAAFAAKESNTTQNSPKAMRWRRFDYNGKEVVMEQHLKIGVGDSINRTLRIHFHWDPEVGRVVIGHCGKHLPLPGH
ncbi:hypothetical protein KBZ20_16615 [Vulcanococcus limneticus Candia 3F8]|uniref:HIRAN domain-containing protein n=1 Tax=Vulcanococcus limneticus TaxID=2170428 RepID=UPI000B989033|nr:HIRAN domain-containing protein [Vulcanococcus limneticus]MCP9793377.1 hypothetical protein [Vulcanococcus limneticus MW73D5]MCP9895389.1 hypothetical protein [Vulcanococcus limneticus Candia 3F8]MCP9898752.1 hypothetical protein [Vulcanococcus limneticus Candia 3B3]